VNDEGSKVRRSPRGFALLSVLAMSSMACAATQTPVETPARTQGARGHEYTRNPSEFSPSRAWKHVEALTQFGGRGVGTRANERARDYLRERLTSLGAEVREFPLPIRETPLPVPSSIEGEESASSEDPDGGDEAVHLVGILPGASPSAILLVAHYDTAVVDGLELVGANDGASGPALVLELGRLLALAEAPYTIWLVLLDGEAAADGSTVNEPAHLGSRGFAAHLFEAEPELAEAIRLGIFFNQVCDVDLTIARDLNSHSVYRDLFWEVGYELGDAPSFSSDQSLRLIKGSHLGFRDAGLRRVVAIGDDQLGPGIPPGAYWRTERDALENCSAASLEQVGRVSREAIARIMQRLERIDQFAEAPWKDIESRDAPTAEELHSSLPLAPSEPTDPVQAR
jgi:hypothetical protein